MGKTIAKNPMASSPVASPATKDPRTVLARDQIHDSDNPYQPDFHYPDDSLCVKCGAVYRHQHWNLDEKRRDLLRASGAANEVTCPACRITAGRDPQGIVTLAGDYWPEHRGDILNLVRNEEARGMADNPLERIIDIREEGDSLIVETTNTKLAQRIGRAVHSAHKGTVDYRWPDGDHLLRVYWERGANGK